MNESGLSLLLIVLACAATKLAVAVPAVELPPQATSAIWQKEAASPTPNNRQASFTDSPQREKRDEVPDVVHTTSSGLTVSLRAATHAVQSLQPNAAGSAFSFVPPLSGTSRPTRTAAKCHALGDITVRVRPSDAMSGWATFSSANAGSTHPPVPLPGNLSAGVFAADNITEQMLALSAQPYGLGMTVARQYEEGQDGELIIRINITATADIVLGGFGMTLPADDNYDGLTLGQIVATNSLIDPYIGLDAGYAEWTRVSGNQSIFVLPATRTMRLEAWRPILEDCHSHGGGMFEWTSLSAAWAEDWKLNQQYPINNMSNSLLATGSWPNPRSPWPSLNSQETFRLEGMGRRFWNTPTSMKLVRGETAVFAVSLWLSQGGPRTRDTILAQANHPIIHAVPGYTVSTEMSSAKLFIKLPQSVTLSQVASENTSVLNVGSVSTLASGVAEIPITGMSRGRVAVLLELSDGRKLAVHYHVLPPFNQQVAALGAHWADVAWLPLSYPDPFGRSASVMPWDREDQRHILDDARAYDVGLSDDAGAGNNLGLASKVANGPTQHEVSRIDEYINWTLIGTKPQAKWPQRSLQDPDTHLVRMTLYYYCAEIGSGFCTAAPHWPYNYTEQDKCYAPLNGPIWCMDESMANQTYRGYNYPHQATVWYSMYLAARNYNFTTMLTWRQYLEHAYKTAAFIGTGNLGYMVGTVLREILVALEYEGADDPEIAGWAAAMTKDMSVRADGWATTEFPYGSEYNWDTTGQEEVYVWLSYFGFTEEAAATLEAVLAYMRTAPNWAYNGGSWSLGDLGNNGKWFINTGVERGLMHYRAGLNAIPVLEAYRSNPDDYHLLEVGAGAVSGQLCNIDEKGAPSMMFHTSPFVLEFDPNSGDYGLGFFGHSLETGSYLVNHTTYGLVCFQCDVTSSPDLCGVTSNPALSLKVTVRDSFKRRVFIEPLGLYLVLETGTFEHLIIDFTRKQAVLHFSAITDQSQFEVIRLRVTKTASGRTTQKWAVYQEQQGAAWTRSTQSRGAYEVVPASRIDPKALLVWN